MLEMREPRTTHCPIGVGELFSAPEVLAHRESRPVQLLKAFKEGNLESLELRKEARKRGHWLEDPENFFRHLGSDVPMYTAGWGEHCTCESHQVKDPLRRRRKGITDQAVPQGARLSLVG